MPLNYSLRMKRVLVVEDDKYLNKLICDFLSIEGFHVESARDGESAWTLLSGDSSWDAVVVDMLLPKKMGAELLTEINETEGLQNLKKICMSGVYKDAQDVERLCHLHQLEGYLTKPFELAELLALLKGEEFQKSEAPLSKGDLKQSPLERLFFQSYCAAFTGSLDLEWEESSRRIYFLNGHPVSASSSALSENLGSFLVQEAYISEDQRDEISRKMAEESIYFGEALLSLGYLEKAELYQALRQHTYKILTHCFSTRGGQFQFKVLEELPSHLPHIEFNPFLLMLESQRKQISAAALEALFQIKAEDFPHREPRFFQCLALFAPGEELLKKFQTWSGSESLSQWFKRIELQEREKAQRILYLAESLKILHWKSEPQNDLPDTRSFQFDQERERESAAANPQTEAQIRELYMDALNQNYFELLGVAEDSSTEEIDKQYRDRRYQSHPDRYESGLAPEAKRILQDYLTRLDKAYQCLSDHNRRKAYQNDIFRMSEDSAADSKRFLQAQDLFYQAQKHLAAERFSEAKLLFDRAAATWAMGVEYRMYSLYTDFRASKDKKFSERQGLLLKLKDLVLKHSHLETGFLLLGHAHRYLQQISAAREAYQKALAIQPELLEALNALSRLAERERSRFRFPWPQKLPKQFLRKTLLLALALSVLIPLWQFKESFQKTDPNMLKPDPASLKEFFQAKDISIQNDIAQVLVLEGETKGIPDAVIRHKCQRSLNLLQAYGASRLYVVEEKLGLSARCSAEQFQRY